MDAGVDPYKPLWPMRILCIPEMDDGKGRIIMICTHALMDGTQFLATVLLISDYIDPNNKTVKTATARTPIYQKVMAELGTPIGYLKVLKDLFTLPIQRNVIKGTFATDDIKRKVRFSKDMSLKAI